MNKKRKSVGQTLGKGVAAMFLFTILSCALMAVFIGREIVPEKAGSTICWMISLAGAYVVSWYTAKRSENNKMQMAAAVVGVHGCICAVIGRLMFSDMKLQMSIWAVLLAVAAVAGGVTSCIKKTRRR